MWLATITLTNGKTSTRPYVRRTNAVKACMRVPLEILESWSVKEMTELEEIMHNPPTLTPETLAIGETFIH